MALLYVLHLEPSDSHLKDYDNFECNYYFEYTFPITIGIKYYFTMVYRLWFEELCTYNYTFLELKLLIMYTYIRECEPNIHWAEDMVIFRYGSEFCDSTTIFLIFSISNILRKY